MKKYLLIVVLLNCGLRIRSLSNPLIILMAHLLINGDQPNMDGPKPQLL